MSKEKIESETVKAKEAAQEKGLRQQQDTTEQKDREQRPEQREQQRPDQRQDRQAAPKGGVTFTDAVPARVEELIGKTGTRGEAIQIRCKILDGRDRNKIIRRNVKGPVRVGDMLMLRETEIEAQKLTQRRR